MHLVPQAAQRGDEGVFERRIVDAYVVDRKAGGVHALLENPLRRFRIVREQIEAVAESLHVDNFFFWAADRGQNCFCFAQISRCAVPGAWRAVVNAARPACRSVAIRPDTSRPRGCSVPLRPDKGWPPGSSGHPPRGAREHPRIRGAIPDRRRWSARRAEARAAGAPARRPATISASSRRSAVRRAGPRSDPCRTSVDSGVRVPESRSTGTRRRSPM